MYPAVHIAADIAVVETEHAIFAEAHHLDLMLSDTGIHELSLHCLCPLHAKLHVVADRALLVCIALYENTEIGIVLRQVGLRGEDCFGVVGESLAAHLKIDIRMDAGGFDAGCGNGWAVYDWFDGRGRAGLEHVRNLSVGEGLSRGLCGIGLALPGEVPKGSDDDGQAQNPQAYDIDLLCVLTRSDNGRGNIS